MAKFTIELTDAFTFESRGVTYGPFNPDNLSDEIVAKLALHGLKQKLADKLADPKITDRADAVAKAWEGLANGVWRAKTGGHAGMTEFESVAWDMIESAVRAKVMAEKGVKKVKELTDADHDRIESDTDAVFARPGALENPKLVAAVNAEIAARAAKRAAKEMDLGI